MGRVLACSLVALGFWAGHLYADDAAQTETTGKVSAIDRTEMTVTLSEGKTKTPYVVNAKTQFVDEEGRAIKAGFDTARLKEGVKVTITYEKKRGQLVALWVKIRD
jgi:hypothetical protein